jgi:hypothetical protein
MVTERDKIKQINKSLEDEISQLRDRIREIEG